MKNTAKTLTLTAKKAPAKSAAPLAVPKTATSYFLETEAAAKVTVVKTRSRLASLKAQADAEPVAAQADDVAAELAEAAAAPVQDVAPVAALDAEAANDVANEAANDGAEDYMPAVPATPAAPPVIVRKRGKLAALKA
ncbi:RNA polymerase sigma factor RpoD, partial [Massilia sp. ST3]|nr:RNA polymerase sigma factor RpoD [Massilia sp. ST3]